jgi:hypothetical protein
MTNGEDRGPEKPDKITPPRNRTLLEKPPDRRTFTPEFPRILCNPTLITVLYKTLPLAPYFSNTHSWPTFFILKKLNEAYEITLLSVLVRVYPYVCASP